MSDTYTTIQDLLTDLEAILGSADAVAEALAGEDHGQGRAVSDTVDRINNWTDGSDDAHTAVYDWMVEHDASGWDDEGTWADVDDDMMDAEF